VRVTLNRIFAKLRLKTGLPAPRIEGKWKDVVEKAKTFHH
jgi:hypothetical protein